MDIDVRDVLASVRVPTLLMYRPPDAPDADETQDVPMARYMAERIPGGARRAEITEDEFWATDVLPHLTDFLTDAWSARDRASREQRVLATVLFTDIVGASERAAELGDRGWRDLLEQHHAAVRRQLLRFRGVEIDTAGDGFFASFDGPARAISCACAVVETVRELGIEVRAGVHTGECEVIDGKVAGIAVHTGARVAAEAQPGEVLVSRTVKDLVAGSGLAFQDRGLYELKGIPGEWQLYAVDASSEIDRERPALAGD
jgi:class 3 adenylate cyclase